MRATGTITTTEQASITGEAFEGQDAIKTTTNCDPLGLAEVFKEVKPTSAPTAAFVYPEDDEYLYADRYNYKGFTLDGQNDLDLKANPDGKKEFIIYVDGDFKVSGQAELKIDKGVKVSIYVTGKVTIDGQADIIVPGDPEDFVIISNYPSASGINFGGQSESRAILYAPLTDVSLSGQSDFRGAVRGKTVSLEGQSDFYFDEILKAVVQLDDNNNLAQEYIRDDDDKTVTDDDDNSNSN